MRTGVSGALAVSLVFFAGGCGNRALDPVPDPVTPGQPAAPLPNTDQVTVHVKGMTKALNLF
jgi:hypothetical protein